MAKSNVTPIAERRETREISSLSGRSSLGVFCEPAMASKMFGSDFDIPMMQIVARREAMRKADFGGKYNTHAGGFSPSGNVKLALEMPYPVAIAAKAAYGKDVFTNPVKRRLFAQEHPEYAFNIRR